jgi:hypothetical protein
VDFPNKKGEDMTAFTPISFETGFESTPLYFSYRETHLENGTKMLTSAALHLPAPEGSQNSTTPFFHTDCLTAPQKELHTGNASTTVRRTKKSSKKQKITATHAESDSDN